MINNPNIPSVSQLSSLIKYYMDVNCYDLTDEEVYKSMTQDTIEFTLNKFKYIHIKDGNVCCNSQNLIIDNWIDQDMI